MDPSGTPALTGYSCEDFPTRTTRSRLLLRKEEISQISDLKFHKVYVCEEDQHAKLYRKALNVSRVTARVAPDLLKALAVLSDTTVRRPAVDREDVKPYWKSERRSHFSRWTTILLLTSFSKTLLTTERRLTGR